MFLVCSSYTFIILHWHIAPLESYGRIWWYTEALFGSTQSAYGFIGWNHQNRVPLYSLHAHGHLHEGWMLQFATSQEIIFNAYAASFQMTVLKSIAHSPDQGQTLASIRQKRLSAEQRCHYTVQSLEGCGSVLICWVFSLTACCNIWITAAPCSSSMI